MQRSKWTSGLVQISTGFLEKMFLPNHLISVATQQFLDSKIYDFNTARLESPSYLMPRALDHSLPISFATYESSSTITPQSTKFTSRDLATVRVNSPCSVALCCSRFQHLQVEPPEQKRKACHRNSFESVRLNLVKPCQTLKMTGTWKNSTLYLGVQVFNAYRWS